MHSKAAGSALAALAGGSIDDRRKVAEDGARVVRALDRLTTSLHG